MNSNEQPARWVAPIGRELLGVHAVGANRDQLAGLDFADQLRADRVQRAALGGDRPAVAVRQPTQHQRPECPTGRARRRPGRSSA